MLGTLWIRFWTWLRLLFAPKLPPTVVREPDYLWVERDQAVRDNWEFIKNMALPGSAKEKEMAKRRKIKLDIVDAPRPKSEGGVISLRSPIPLALKGKIQVEVKLGLSADAPLLLFGASHLERQGLKLVNPGPVDAGTPLVAKFENTTSDGAPFFIEQGETLLKAVVLESDVEIE